MTDTEYDVDVDDEAMFGDEGSEDEELDFENLFPPDGAYEVVIKDVSYRDGISEKSGKRTRGLNIRCTIVQPDGEFDGTLVSTYIFLGWDTFQPNGRKQMKSFCEAVGVPCEGSMRIADFQPVKQTIGKREEKVLTVFSGLSCGAFLKTEEKDINGQKSEQCQPTAFITLERLAEINGFEPDPNPF